MSDEAPKVKLPRKRGQSYLFFTAPKKTVRQYAGQPRCSRKFGRARKRAFILGIVHRLGMTRKFHEFEAEELARHGMPPYQAMIRAYRKVARLCSMLPDGSFKGSFDHLLPPVIA